MRIEGLRDGIWNFLVVLIASVSFPIVVNYDSPTSGAIVFSILCSVTFLLFSSILLVKQRFTYYVLDKDGITEYFFSRSRTFLWDECRFIKKVGISSLGSVNTAIICCKESLPVGISARQLLSYHWPKEKTILIGNRPDSVYREFLIWCGGERDIRT